MKILSTLWPAWKKSKKRIAHQSEPKNQARKEFSEAVVQLGRRTSDVTRIANAAIESMHGGKGH